MVRSRGCSARCAYWNVNYLGVIRAARSVVGHREQAVYGLQGRNCSSIRCVLLRNIRKFRRMRKQSKPGLPSFRGWP